MRLLRIKNEIRCEELAKVEFMEQLVSIISAVGAGSFETAAPCFSAKGQRCETVCTIGSASKHVAGGTAQAIKGKLSQEDVPRFTHLGGTKHHREHVRPKDAGYIIELIQNLRVINEMLHQGFGAIPDFGRHSGRKYFKQGENGARKSWERQMADDICARILEN